MKNIALITATLLFTVSAWAAIIKDDFASGQVTKDSVRFHESDIDQGWQAPSAHPSMGGAESAWEIDQGKLQNASSATGTYAAYIPAEGSVVQVVSNKGRGTKLTLSFEYKVAPGDKLYVGVMGYDGQFDKGTDFIGNYEFSNGHFANLTTKAKAYSLKDGLSPQMEGVFSKWGPLTGSGRFNETVTIFDLGMIGSDDVKINDVKELEYIGLYFAKDEDGQAGTTSIDNLSLFAAP